MTLIEDIKKRFSELDRTASEKDRIFYQYLNDKIITIPENNNKTDIIKICYSAFAKKFNEKQLVKTLQKTQPIKGLHYTNNLVELIAMALYAFEEEKKNLQNYIKSHNAKETYIINKIFPNIEYKKPVKIETTVDKLVNDVLIEGNIENGERKLVDALKDANDLLDIYLIEEAMEICYELHPSTVDKNNIKYLLTFYLRLHKVLNFVFSSIFYLIIVGGVLYLAYRLTPSIVSNWNVLDAYIFIIQTVTTILTAIILTIFQIKFNIYELIKPIEKKIVYFIESSLFKIIGMDLSKILEIQSVLKTDLILNASN